MTANKHPDIRNTMISIGRRLPNPFYNTIQSLLTWLTGKPLSGQMPYFPLGPWLHLTSTIAVLSGSAAASVGLWNAGGLWLCFLPLSIGATVSASRVLWLTDLHAAAHGSFSHRSIINRIVGDVVSLPLLVLSATGYRTSHITKHHGPGFCSEDDDDDAAFLHWLGIRPGRSRLELWIALLRGLVAPRTHLVYLRARLRANLLSSGGWRRLWTVTYLCSLALAGHLIGYGALIVAWVLPLTILYQMSSITGWAGEHLWFHQAGSDRKGWLRDATHARLLGEPYPNVAPLSVRLGWWARLVLIHAPSRLLVVPGDLPAHDWHHRYPRRSEWPHAIYARQRDIENGHSFPHETWGVFGAIDRVFDAIARMEPRPESNSASTRHTDLLLGM